MSEKNTIPNLKVETIGSRARPHHLIKGFIVLPCWEGYYLYDDSYKLIKNKVVTHGRIELFVDGAIDSGNNIEFTMEQINAYWFLIDHQEIIKRSILNYLKQVFPDLLSEDYSSWDHDDPMFPRLYDLTPAFDFKDYIGPESIIIGEDVKDGSAYISWRFRCRWDIEHGIDIITHKERVIEIAPEADPWKIAQDNGTYEQELKEYNSRTIIRRAPEKRKWWQFW